MSETERDPILEEFHFCETCEPNVLNLVAHVRDQENALLVAKQAIESISSLNKRLTEKYHKLRAEFDIFLAGLQKQKRDKEAFNLKKSMDEMDKQVQRFENRQKILS